MTATETAPAAEPLAGRPPRGWRHYFIPVVIGLFWISFFALRTRITLPITVLAPGTVPRDALRQALSDFAREKHVPVRLVTFVSAKVRDPGGPTTDENSDDSGAKPPSKPEPDDNKPEPLSPELIAEIESTHPDAVVVDRNWKPGLKLRPGGNTAFLSDPLLEATRAKSCSRAEADEEQAYPCYGKLWPIAKDIDRVALFVQCPCAEKVKVRASFAQALEDAVRATTRAREYPDEQTIETQVWEEAKSGRSRAPSLTWRRKDAEAIAWELVLPEFGKPNTISLVLRALTGRALDPALELKRFVESKSEQENLARAGYAPGTCDFPAGVSEFVALARPSECGTASGTQSASK